MVRVFPVFLMNMCVPFVLGFESSPRLKAGVSVPRVVAEYSLLSFRLGIYCTRACVAVIRRSVISYQGVVYAGFEDPFEPFAKFDDFFNMTLHFFTIVEVECEFRGFFHMVVSSTKFQQY